MKKHPLFTNRVGVIATMHHKEKVIAPILERELGIKVIVPNNFDTDAFGTFTREVERKGTQLEAARLKAEKALAVTGDLAFASEGTFGPHPAIPFIACNREIVILLDRANEIEIVGQEFSTETNYSHKVVKSFQEALDFCKQVGFPEHGVVVMASPSPKDNSEIIKGITTEEHLLEAVTALKISCDRSFHIETDMRALYNPTRMKNIERATYNLIEKINHSCPTCNLPGFEVIERKRGLRCGACNLPTESILAAIYQCKKCGFRQEVLFPDGLEKADPAQCMYCNP